MKMLIFKQFEYSNCEYIKDIDLPSNKNYVGARYVYQKNIEIEIIVAKEKNSVIVFLRYITDTNSIPEQKWHKIMNEMNEMIDVFCDYYTRSNRLHFLLYDLSIRFGGFY